ncbi:chain length determinant protein (polysaccharide antigen chain regulator) [Cricetibacter osteomyelitidis]|uniref:Chain length determinant protein (Polysaccharide antigen chain regulator) n=1 Tax=Cricetibacter osteomyelitidis TaxID=1521931 RepID=A0A4R2T0E2_9PAST|nr:Wzz/FepE/Etk N-terminal domain-containing protein [Cricetibacter osteomyelitidis]TCP95530.1 chain length determinant protein (polysaccharide antigen chain regulator) [Cricetibacter osteomyelitidis]
MPNSHIQHNDEINLIELITLLWDKKIRIILTALITTLFAAVYAFTAKEQWTSNARVVEPTYAELGGYLQLRNEYSRILGIKDDKEKKETEIVKEIFARFSQLAQSADEKEAFFINSDVYKIESEGKDEQEQRKILAKLVNEAIVFTQPDPKKEPNAVDNRISFYAETPALAQDTLKAFIAFINEKAYKQDLNDFLVLFDKEIKDLKHEQQEITQNLIVENIVQLNNLNKAYDIAAHAGIKEYNKSFNYNETAAATIAAANAALADSKISLADSKLNEGLYLFMLGEKYLKAQIDVVKSDKLIYPPRYYQIADQLKQLEPLFAKAQSVEGQSCSYLASPDYPVVKDKPKKLIILIIGLLLGLILSSFVILLSRAFKKEKA